MIKPIIHTLIGLAMVIAVPRVACAERSGCPRMAIAAQQGDPDRQFLYAQALDKGYCGFKVDEHAAFHWYRRAAEQGQVEAQSRLGHMYFYGRGTKSDRVEAYFWLSLAAKAGDTEAAKNKDEAKKRLTARQLAKVMARVNMWKPTARTP